MWKFEEFLVLSALILLEGVLAQSSLGVEDGVHHAYVKGEGCQGHSSNCIRCHAAIYMDGVKCIDYHMVNGQYGTYVCTYSYPEFTFKEHKRFDTHGSDPQPLIDFLDGLPQNTIILACVRDDGATSMTPAAWAALDAIGLKNPYKAYRSAYALIGYKGDWPTQMTRSASSVAPAVVVNLTYVLPPANVRISLPSSNVIDITWEPLGDRINKLELHYNTTMLDAAFNHSVRILDSSSRYLRFGPLAADAWYSFTLRANLTLTVPRLLIHSKPYFVIGDNNNIGCDGGLYEFILKVDGNQNTFGYDSVHWQKGSPTLNGYHAYTGFNKFESKPPSYASTVMKRICAGMQELATSQFTFTQLKCPALTMDAWQGSTGTPAGPNPVDAWNRLTPAGIIDVGKVCHEGIKDNTNIKYRFGFKGAPQDGGDCRFVTAGYGLKIGNADYASAAVGKTPTVVKKTFGYLLVPYYVDAVWLNWGNWSECDKNCGTGTIIRFRNSTVHLGEGLVLPASSSETGSCKIQDCIPPAPENVLATTKTKRTLDVEWKMVPRAALTNDPKHYLINITMPDGQFKLQQVYHGSAKTIIYGLEIYTVYCLDVQLVLVSDTHGNRSATVCARTDEDVPLDPPSNINATMLTAWCLLVTWDPIPIARAQGIITQYKIAYTVAGENTWRTVFSTSNSSQEICGLQPYTEYRFRMRGLTSKGPGPRSAVVGDFRTDEYIPSQAPNIISTEHTSSRSIKVKWQTLVDSFWNGVPLSYTVYFILKDTYDVSNTDRDVYFVNASYPATEVEVVELTPYKVYVIWMTASTVKGSGPNTTDYRQRTDSEVPARGPNATAHNSSSFSILVNWTQLDVQYRYGILSNYRVFCTNLKTGTEVTKDVPASETFADIPDLRPFQNHSIEVAGVNDKGVGARGTAFYTFTDEYKPSLPPVNFNGVNSSSYVLELHWSPIPEEERLGIIFGYTILYKEAESKSDEWNATIVYGADVLVERIYNLTAYQDYKLKIAGFTKMGNGNFSAEIIVRTEEDSPYAPPATLNSTEIKATTAVIHWAPPDSSHVRGIIRGYTIMYSAVYNPVDFTSHLLTKKTRKRRSVISKPVDLQQHNITVGSNQLQLTLTNLQGATNYSIRILAFTKYIGVLSDPYYIFTKENIPAMAPLNVSAHNTTYTALMVEWKHIYPAYAHGFLQGFVVSYQLGIHSEAVAENETQVADKEFLELTHLQIFSWYTIQVAAYNKIGVGIKSKPIYARTDEWIPCKAPTDVKAKSFMMPYEFNVTWTHLPVRPWYGVPLGYLVTATALSIGGVQLAPWDQFRKSVRVSYPLNSYFFRSMKPFYKYGITVLAYTRIGDGIPSAMTNVETCNVANSVLRSSWADYLPLIAKNPKSAMPDGFLPSVLANLLKRCSGLCIGLNIKGNASINYLKDGQGKTARKTNLNELYATMSTDTDIIFPVFKPSYPNEDYRFIEVMSMGSVLLVEGKPLVNTVGQGVSSAIVGLLALLAIFIIFCLLAGSIVWLLEICQETGELRRHPAHGISDGFYWAYVTATTVGYGDYAHTSVTARIFTMVWSLIGLILVGFLSGSLSSVFTASSVVKIATVPKSGVGMVRDSWEFVVAKKKGVKVDKNFSDYKSLLDEVGSGTLKYGIVSSDIGEIWTAKFIKDSISVKTVLGLDGSLGFFLTGDMRQLGPCLETNIKEEAMFIMIEHLKAVQAEAIAVSKSLQVDQTLTLEVTPSEPEFFSWESQVMQKYVKGGSAAFGVFIVFGCIYEVVRRVRQRKKRNTIRSGIGPNRSGKINFTPGESSELVEEALSKEDDLDENETPLDNLNKLLNLIKERQLTRRSLNSGHSILGDPILTNDSLEEVTTPLIEELVLKLETVTEEMELVHCKQRLKLQQEKWKKYGVYKYIDPTDYGVPFE